MSSIFDWTSPASGDPAQFEECNSLRPNQLALPQLIGQAVATVTPSGGIALGIGVIFGFVGSAAWLVYAVTAIVILIVSVNLNVISVGMVSSAGPAAAVARILGTGAGIICGWSLICAYTFAGIASAAAAGGYFLYSVGFNRPSPVALATASALVVIICWILAYRDVRVSANMMLYSEVVTITILFLLICIGLAYPFSSPDTEIQIITITPKSFFFAAVLGITACAGFESAKTMGEEAKNSEISQRLCLVSSVCIIGLCFTASAVAMYYAFERRADIIAGAESPFQLLADREGVPFLGNIIEVGVSLSFLACTLACLAASARLTFAFSRSGLLPRRLAFVHPRYATPHLALALLSSITLLSAVVAGSLNIEPKDLFAPLGAFSGVGFVLVYFILCVAAWRFQSKSKGNFVARNSMPAIGCGVLIIIFVGLFYGDSGTSTVNYLPIGALIAILLASTLSLLKLRILP